MRNSLPLLLALLGSASVPAQDEPSPSKAKAEQRAKRDQQLQPIVKRLARSAEKYSELEFLKPPVVEAATHAEWRQLLKKEFLPDGDTREVLELAMTLVGVYLPEPPRVVLSPVTLGPLLAPKREGESRLASERRMQHEATIVHELVHALQGQHSKLATRLDAAEDPEEIQLIKGLMEGHAVFVEERFAELEWKFEDFMDRGPYRVQGADPSYNFGHRYFTHVFREHGMKGVHDQLVNPPTYQEFVELGSKSLPEEAPEAKDQAQEKGAKPPGKSRVK